MSAGRTGYLHGTNGTRPRDGCGPEGEVSRRISLRLLVFFLFRKKKKFCPFTYSLGNHVRMLHSFAPPTRVHSLHSSEEWPLWVGPSSSSLSHSSACRNLASSTSCRLSERPVAEIHSHSPCLSSPRHRNCNGSRCSETPGYHKKFCNETQVWPIKTKFEASRSQKHGY